MCGAAPWGASPTCPCGKARNLWCPVKNCQERATCVSATCSHHRTSTYWELQGLTLLDMSSTWSDSAPPSGPQGVQWPYTTLHYTTLHYTTFHYTSLHYTTTTATTTKLHSTTLNYTTLHNITLHYTTLHSTTLHYTTLHYTTLRYTEWHCTTDRQVDRYSSSITTKSLFGLMWFTFQIPQPLSETSELSFFQPGSIKAVFKNACSLIMLVGGLYYLT